jgi:hypothetical protein
MTVVPSSGGLAIPVPEEDYGLEDFDPTTDAIMPRLQIDHKEALFVDNLSGQKFSELDVILLGLVKQRIMWADEVEDGEGPLCKSFNYTEGHPSPDFPWEKSKFDKASYPDDAVLPCANCYLKEWGSALNGKTPWCSEQHTFPLLMQLAGGWAPALFTTQRTGIKPSKTYLTSFSRTKTPLYTVITKLSLQAYKRGTVDYAVPVFVQKEATESSEWPFYAQQYRSIRSFISTRPSRDDDEAAAPAAPAVATAAAPAAADDDIPF